VTGIREDRQLLQFDSRWRVVRWDEADEFKGSMEPTFSNLTSAMRSVKAGDVVAIREATLTDPPLLLVAEFKDFDHPNILPHQRAAAALHGTSHELMSDVLAKVIDTLTGATYAHDQQGVRCDELRSWRATAADNAANLLVLICVELPRTQIVAAQTWTTDLKRRLAWLGPNAHVVVTTSAAPYDANGVRYALA
jgi:hypothetical protein